MSDTAFELIVLLGWPIPVVGALLLFRGIRGRRVGDEPRCRKCKYILIGISSSRCPECGRDVTAKGRQVGLWRLRRVAFATGLCLALISLAVVEQYVYPRVYSYVNGVDWYRYYPTDWLLSLVDRDTAVIGKELVDRLDRGLLSEEQREEFTELLITK